MRGLDDPLLSRVLRSMLNEQANNRDCRKCERSIPLQAYDINQTLRSGRILFKHTCKTCRSDQARARAVLKRRHTRPPLGVDCPICERRTSRPVLDHDHSTGLFRGWICNDCNNALGKFCDSVVVLRRAIAYLDEATTPISSCL